MAERVTREVQDRRAEQGNEPAQEYPVTRKVGGTAVNSSVEAQEPDILDTIDELLEDEGTRGRDLEALLDEIDAVLEENPAEVVASYVQRGGE